MKRKCSMKYMEQFLEVLEWISFDLLKIHPHLFKITHLYESLLYKYFCHLPVGVVKALESAKYVTVNSDEIGRG